MHHCISSEDVVENGKIIKCYLDYLEVGPLTIPDAFHFNIIKRAIRNISKLQVAANWWRDFSSWEDYHGLPRTGTSNSMHLVVSEIESRFKLIKDGCCYIRGFDKNGNITMFLHEYFPTIMRGYIITAKRKKLRTLKQIAAYNVAECLSSEEDIKQLQIPHSLYKLVTTFLYTYSGSYMNQ